MNFYSIFQILDYIQHSLISGCYNEVVKGEFIKFLYKYLFIEDIVYNEYIMIAFNVNLNRLHKHK